MYEGPIQDLIDELARLPGVGPKSAQRLAFWLIKAPDDDARRLAAAIVSAKDRIAFCRECGNVAEGDLCRICRDESRDRTLLVIVEEPKDAASIERSALHKGRYHILGGAISPLDGVGPEDLRVQELLTRVERDHVTECWVVRKASQTIPAPPANEHNIAQPRIAGGRPGSDVAARGSVAAIGAETQAWLRGGNRSRRDLGL